MGMAKLADIIKPMKEAFFVAHLHPPEYAEKWKLKQIEEKEDNSSSSSPDGNASKRVKLEEDEEELKDESVMGGVKAEADYSAENSSAVKMEVDEENKIKVSELDNSDQNNEETEQKQIEDTEKGKLKDGDEIETNETSINGNENNEIKQTEVNDTGTVESKEEVAVKEEKMDIEQKEVNETKTGDEEKVETALQGKDETNDDKSNSAAAATTNGENKEEMDKELKKEGAVPEKEETEEEKEAKLMKFQNDMTEDVDDTQESDYFGTRQDVLQLCQGNHYQFDQLRRAKHTSMMILYHLHNPDAPKFVPLCTLCSKEILVGYRYRCDSCDVDYCQSCIQTRGPPQNLHPHPLRAMAVQGGAPTQLTEEQRKERQKSIDMHLHLLKHAANCVNKECRSKNCFKMKEFLKHGRNCPTGVKGGCLVCKRINNLLTLHARSCRTDKCSVPKCIEMREQMRQIELRQQQMDDRRRA